MNKLRNPVTLGLHGFMLVLFSQNAWGLPDAPVPSEINQSINEFDNKLPTADAHTLAESVGGEFSPAKERLKAPNADTKNAYRSKFGDNPTCPYLTKPVIRADGGGLNRYALGSVVCFNGKMHTCTEYGWDLRDTCLGGLPTAEDVENSSFSTQINLPDDSESPSGRNVGKNSAIQQNGGGPDTNEAPRLLGESPTGQLLLNDQKYHQQLEQQMQHQLGLQQQKQQFVSGDERLAGKGASGNLRKCTELRNEMAAGQREIENLERFARQSTVDGSINPRYASEINNLRATLQREFQAHMRSNGCL